MGEAEQAELRTVVAIGEALRDEMAASAQPYELTVELPKELVDAAVQCWLKSQHHQASGPDDATDELGAAAVLGLIGLELDAQRPGPAYSLSVDLARDAVDIADRRARQAPLGIRSEDHDKGHAPCQATGSHKRPGR